MINFETTSADYRLYLNGQQLLPDSIIPTEISFQEKLGETARVRLRFDDQEGFPLLFNQIKFESPVALSLGWFGNVEPLFEGHVVAIEPEFNQDGDATLQVVAQDLGYLLKRPKPPRFDYGDDMLQVVRRILATYDLDLVVDPTKTLRDWKLSDEEEISRQGQTDLQILTWIAEHAGYQIQVRGEKLYFVDKDYWEREQTESFVFFYAPRSQDFEHSRGLDLDRFQPELKLAGVRTNVEVLAWSSIDAKGFKRGSGRLNQAGKGESNLTQIRVKTEEELTLRIYGTVAESAAGAKAIAQAEIDRRAAQMVRGQARLKGWTPLRVGQKHEFRINALGNIGTIFSGVYRLTGVEHRFDSQGFMTSFDVSRETVNLIG